MASKSSSSAKPLYLAGKSWESSVSPGTLSLRRWFPSALQAFRAKYNIPVSRVLEVPGCHVPAVDVDEMVGRVPLYHLMFPNGLHLPICHLVRNVLNLLGLAPAQLHLNAWQLLVASCIIYWRVLNTGSEEYPNLTTQEFLSVYHVLHLDESFCSFQACMVSRRIASLESRHSLIKDWSPKFFFVSSSGWEYPEGEKDHKEFLIQVVWSYVPLANSLSVDFSRKEEARLATLLFCVSAHPYDAETDVVLCDVNIRSYLTALDRSYVLGTTSRGTPHRPNVKSVTQVLLRSIARENGQRRLMTRQAGLSRRGKQGSQRRSLRVPKQKGLVPE